MVEHFASAPYLNIVFISFYLQKMKVLTYTLYKEHCDLYTEIHGPIAVNNDQIESAQKDMISLSKASIITYAAGKRTGVENKKIINFSLSEGTYSIDDFNEKTKVEILQQRKDWEPSQIKDLKLVILEDNIHGHQYYCYRAWYTRQVSWKDYTNKVNITS